MVSLLFVRLFLCVQFLTQAVCLRLVGFLLFEMCILYDSAFLSSQ